MKKYYIGILMVLFFQTINAQEDITLFRLVNKKLVNAKTVVLYHNLKDNKAITAAIPTKDVLKASTGYLQSVIFKEDNIDKAAILISSLKSKKHFLKYDKVSGKVSYSLLDKSIRDNYLWQVIYAGGNDKIALIPLVKAGYALANEGANFELKSLVDNQGNAINNKVTKLADKFIFSLQKIKNVL